MGEDKTLGEFTVMAREGEVRRTGEVEEEGGQVKRRTRKRAKRMDRVGVGKRSQGWSRFTWTCW